MTLRLVFAASLLDVQHYRESVKNKSASLLVVPSGKARSGGAGFTYRLSRLKPRASEKMGASKKMGGLITKNVDFFFGLRR